MNFDKLFNQVFLTEQDEPVIPAEEVPAAPTPETDGTDRKSVV